MKNYNPLNVKTKRSSLKYVLILLLLVLTKLTTTAQNPPVSTLTFIYPFADNFNTYLATDPLAFQSIWSQGFMGSGVYADHGLNNTMGLSINFIPGVSNDSIYGAFGPFNSASELNFSYRFIEYSGSSATNSYSLTPDDYILINFLSYPDSVSTNIAVINNLNHIESIDFQQINIPLTALAGDSGFVSFIFHGIDSVDHWIDIDNISFNDDPLITSVSTEVKSQNLYQVYTDNDHYINLMNRGFNATNQQTLFSIYDMSGRLLASDSFNDEQRINAGNWASGAYFIKLQNDSEVKTQKIILQ